MWRTGAPAATVTAAALGGVLALTLSGPAAAAQASETAAAAPVSEVPGVGASPGASSVGELPKAELNSGLRAAAVSAGQPRSEWHIVADTADDIEGDGHGPSKSAAAIESAAVTPAANRAFWAFALLAPNAPTKAVRWNPCRTITWVWPGSTARDRYWMTRSMQAVSVFSGMSFRQVGTLRADIVVRIAELAPPTVGLGGARATLRRGVWRYEKGTITVDRSWRAKRPSDLKYFSLLQHELGHVVGLRHVNSLAELMYPSIHGQWKFGPGDKIGLRLLGRRSGCIL